MSLTDCFREAALPDSGVTLGLVRSSDICRAAHAAHDLQPTALVALGRLLTGLPMAAYFQHEPCVSSVQFTCSGVLGQIFSDITLDGALRGYTRCSQVHFPSSTTARSEVRPAVQNGSVTLLRVRGSEGETQRGTCDIADGEVDTDLAALLERSDQMPTVLCCDVGLTAEGGVAWAGGVVASVMPDGDMEAFKALRERLVDGGWYAIMQAHNEAPLEAMLAAIDPAARFVSPSKPLRWECRCSYPRVRAALKLLGPEELADMLDKGESAEVDCEFCQAHYVVPADEVEAVYLDTIVARA